jgi:beta-glucosidase
MAAYSGIDGTPVSANKWLLRDVLRGEWDFPGFVVTDADTINHMVIEQYTAKDMEEASTLAVEGGSDSMLDCKGFIEGAIKAIKNGKLDVKLIEDGARRVLETKFKLGLFEDPRHPDEKKAAERHRSPFSLAQAQKMAEEALVLLANDGVLPLDRASLKKIAVVGPNADDVSVQLGDWVENQPRENTITILDGLRAAFPNIDYHKGCGIEPGETANLTAAIEAVESSDVSIVIVGDRGRYCGEGRSVCTLELQGGQIEFLDAVIATKKKFILVIHSMKPLVIPENARKAASAIIWQFSPGNFGGRALARAVFGEINPSGRLSVSIPLHVGQLPSYYYKFRCIHGGYVDMPLDPAWSFGHGLGYSQIDYLSAEIDKVEYGQKDEIHVKVKVKNSGKYAADEVIQIYFSKEITSVTWVWKQLKGFKRQHINPGETVDVEIVIPVSDLWLINAEEQRVVESGKWSIEVAKSSVDAKFTLGFTIRDT